jgi:hypothetical protein
MIAKSKLSWMLLALTLSSCGIPLEGEQEALATGSESLRVPIPSNFVMVTLGDSFAAGEGNPERDFEGPLQWEYWGPHEDAGRCHRSKLSHQVVAGELLKKKLPAGTTFRMANFGCSGADINTVPGDHSKGGLLVPYQGVEPTPFVVMDPQITQANTWLRSKGLLHIDALVISIGVNDMNFGDIVRDCAILWGPNCDNTDFRRKVQGARTQLQGRFIDLKASIEGRARGLPNLNKGSDTLRVFFTKYPNPTRDEHGLCDGSRMAINEELRSLSAHESGYLEKDVLGELNKIIDAQAGRSEDGKVIYEVVDINPGFEGRGICATSDKRLFNTNNDAVKKQGPDHPAFWMSGMLVPLSRGTMHPNKEGHETAGKNLANHMIRTYGL